MDARLRYALRVVSIGIASAFTAALFGGVLVFMIWPLVGGFLQALLETRRGHILLMGVLWIVIFVRLLGKERR
jgi:hypothetical protein